MQAWDYVIAVIAAAGATAFAGLGPGPGGSETPAAQPIAIIELNAETTAANPPATATAGQPHQIRATDCILVDGSTSAARNAPHGDRVELLPPCHL
jgi:hypothetical protein